MPDPTAPALNIIGSGRVGQTLAHLWHRQGVFRVQDILNRQSDNTRSAIARIGAGTLCVSMDAMRTADLWMLATPDAALEATAHALAAHSQSMAPSMAFHCSGAQSAAVLEPLARQGWQVGSAHCILSFATAESAIAQFAGTPCALEGDAAVCVTLEPAFTAIGARCFPVRSEDKLRYHAAAVFATNFVPVLQSVAEDLWRSTGVPESLIEGLRAALLHNAVDNILRLGPRAALTGPAARGDVAAIARQSAAVHAWSSDAGDAYAALSALALNMAKDATK